jgi:hypothetical protein
MYETTKQISDFFGYMNEKQVGYAIKQLVDNGLIILGNYNKNKFDRTTWYALKDEELLDDSKKEFETVDFGKCIPSNLGNGNSRNSEMETVDFGNCIIQEKQQEEHHEEKQQQQGGVVVEEKNISSFKDIRNDSDITKDDIYHYSVATRTDWKPEEIETAWEAFKSSNASVSDPYAYVAGIIQKKRVLAENKASKAQSKQHKEKSCKTYPQKNNKPDVQHSKEKLKNINESILVPDISGHLLDSFVSHKAPSKS